MLDPEEWDWLEEHVTGDFDHLLIGTSLPFLLTHGLQSLEAWNEAVCNGAWGRTAARVGEQIRQARRPRALGRVRQLARPDPSHVERVGTSARAPASIVALSGDVHHAYLAEVGFKPGTGMRSAVYQATCSPFRNPLNDRERAMIRFACSRAGKRLGEFLLRSAGVDKPKVRWRFRRGAVLRQPGVLPGARRPLGAPAAAEDRAARRGPDDEGYGLETVFERPLT